MSTVVLLASFPSVGIQASEDQATLPSGQYYQLAHDYLVHSLRDWLTRKQRERARGRAELRLAERSASWNAKPENRHLPSALEWANIRLLTRKKDWTEPQRKMMRRAGRVHGLRGLGLASLIALITWGGYEAYGSFQARALVDSLKTASTADVPDIVKNLSGYYRWARRPLSDLLSSTKEQSSPHLHASLALLPVDPGQVEYLYNRMLNANPTELPVIREALSGHQWTLIERLWGVLENTQADRDQRFHAAWALPGYVADETEQRWVAASRFITDRLLASVNENPSSYPPLMEMLRPIRKQLLTSLATTFRDPQRPKTERYFATNILADYASDQPNLLADLLMDADPKAYAAFFPIAQEQAAKTLPLFQAELKKPAYSWNDSPLDSSWTTTDANLTAKIESAQGMLREHFAFCQTMPLDEFLTIAEALRKSGYRPVRFRPYADGQAMRVASVWIRDGRGWRIASGLTAEGVRTQDERNRAEKFPLADVAGYIAVTSDGKAEDRYAAIWVEKETEDDSRMYVGATSHDHKAVRDGLKAKNLISRTMQTMRGTDGRLRYCGVWGRSPVANSAWQTYWDQSEEDFEKNLAHHSDKLLSDVAVSGVNPPPSNRERAASALKVAEAALKAKPDDLNARYSRGTTHLQLGESQRAIDELNAVIEKAPQVAAYQYRAIAHARLGHKEQARADLERFQKGDSTESSRLYLAVVVAAELGEGTDQAFEKLEAALQKQPQDAGLHYDAACAYALASQPLAKKDPAKGRDRAERAIHLLQTAIQNGYSNYNHMQEDADLDPIRDLPAFIEIMKVGHVDRSYAAVWTGDDRFEASPLFGLDAAAQLQQCRELASQGYRMVALSVARTSPGGLPITASVWHRPVMTEETKDQLAERQARAGIALVRMDKAEEVWPFLRHSADPRLRSFIVNWLSPLGADPRTIVAEFDRIDPNVKPTPAQGQQLMDAVLFHPETSMRRALILALGTYGTEGLSPAEREPLSVKLHDLYRNDPDSGIHGATAWTLRQWGQQESLKEKDAAMRGKEPGEHRWYVNGQGQTFALIEGPVEFRMGSPPTEPERFSGEILHRRIIPRRFAIATQEVTVEQYQEFVKENPVDDHADNDRYSPDPKGPMNRVSWYHAAAYCNWLSRKENLPECYEPNERGQYAEGMKIRADALQRTGYRLPTEAEWEYGCRAGAGTSRYYGSNVDLLGRYAWYVATSPDRAWPCGQLLPNELGLFDMLGNVHEWCHEQYYDYPEGEDNTTTYDMNILLSIREQNPRLLRGGSFFYRPVFARSAYRWRNAPSNRSSDNGFRPSRTYH